MAITNRERVGRALDEVQAGLDPYVRQELRGRMGDDWWAKLNHHGAVEPPPGGIDVAALLRLMTDLWHNVFGQTLGKTERNYAFEVRDVRNKWAHQEPFSSDDTDRALDTIGRLLRAIGAGPQADAVDGVKHELRRTVYAEQARQQTRKVAAAPVEGAPAAGLRPWREVVTPHPDVSSGNYQAAEFAADLGSVHAGAGAAEYRDPVEFYRRTFLTAGLESLLADAILRVAGEGGDPVVELQTNFGGGKTHAMLALYHLFGDTPARELPGADAVVAAARGFLPEPAHRAVLVGTQISPGQARTKPDGTLVRTLWGELAWQLGGAAGYAAVAEADATGMNPGSDALAALFRAHSPALVLIDELVAYVRQLYENPGKPGGSFDANLTFVQSLTEAAKQADGTLVVASLPASDIEVGGEGGREALERLRNVFARVQSPWRPASTEEGFEIVRRRLFQPIADPDKFAARDAAVRAYAAMYRDQPGEFPPEAREDGYKRRLEAAYPIHPELFDRLFDEWSALDKFQRTRGVLRFMAATINALWEAGDSSVTIAPATVPLGDQRVSFEIRKFLEENWDAVLENDVDGPGSLPLKLDAQNPNFGRYSAVRRVARTLWLGTAPTSGTDRRGIDDRRVKLGAAQPGENVATFGDALRKLADEATHLYTSEGRSWYSTQPSVGRLAKDRAAALDDYAVHAEITALVKAAAADRGQFPRVTACPGSLADLPDERETRLVILGPEHPHGARDEASKARVAAAAILDGGGGSPRRYRNALLFLAPDRARLAELEQAARLSRAWESICKDAAEGGLDLTDSQKKQAKDRAAEAKRTAEARVWETWTWGLAPEQEPLGGVEWREVRISNAPDAGSLPVRAWRKFEAEGLVTAVYGATLLRDKLDGIPLWKEDHVRLRDLVDFYAQYLYLQRLRDPQVLRDAVAQGAGLMLWADEGFAWAERFDPQTGRYHGVHAGDHAPIAADGEVVVVKPAAVVAQREADAARAEEERRRREAAATGAPYVPGTGGTGVIREGGDSGADGSTTITMPPLPPQPPAPVLGRFYGGVALDAARPIPAFNAVAEHVIAHLQGLLGATVTLNLDIEVTIPEGAPDEVVRTVKENARTLGFRVADFEER